MILGAVLANSGVVFLVDAVCASVWGPPDGESSWLYVAGGALISVGLAAMLIDGSLHAVSLASPRVRFVAGVAVVGGAVYASSRVGVPKDLPGIALGWPLLFHIERGSAIVAAVGLIALVLWRGVNGDWPISFGSLFQYAPKEAVKVTADALEKQREKLAILERAQGERLARLEKKLGLPPPRIP